MYLFFTTEIGKCLLSYFSTFIIGKSEIILRMATIPAGQKTCLRAPAGQTKTLLRGKSDFPRSKPPLSSEDSQNHSFRAFQA